MRSLFIVSGLGRGGTERQIAELAPGLVAKGHSVVIAAPYAGEHYEALIRNRGVCVKILQSGVRETRRTTFERVSDFVKRTWALYQLSREHQPDVILGFGRYANVYAAVLGLLLRTRSVWSIRDSRAIKTGVEWWVERLFKAVPEIVICNSYAGRAASLAKGYPGDRLHVVPNGIDVDRFRIDPQYRASARSELGVGERETLIGIVARFEPVKNHELFLRAARLAADTDPSLRFVIIGGRPGARRDSLVRLAEELGLSTHITWTGPRDDVARLINGLDLLVSSSTSEGFSNVVAEAMSCGVPCVVTDVGDSARIVGDLGWVVLTNDVEALATAIIQGRDERNEYKRETLRSRIVEEFSIERMVDRTERLLAGGSA